MESLYRGQESATPVWNVLRKNSRTLAKRQYTWFRKSDAGALRDVEDENYREKDFRRCKSMDGELRWKHYREWSF